MRNAMASGFRRSVWFRVSVVVLLFGSIDNTRIFAQEATSSLADSDWIERLSDDDVRLWMDAAGKHVIEAKLAGKSDSTVTLTRLDGGKTSLGINRLSIADQRFLAGSSSEKSAEDSGASAIPSTVRQFMKIDVQRVTSSAAAREKSSSGEVWNSAAIPIHKNARLMSMDRRGRLVMVTSDSDGESSREVGPSSSVVFDVTSNVALAIIQWPTTVHVLDYDPLADLLLVGTSLDRNSKYGFLIAMSGLRGFRLGGVGYVDATFFLRPEEIFDTGSRFGNDNEMFSGGAIVGDKILVHKFNRVCGVLVGKSKPLWAYPLENDRSIAISPDRRFFAASDEAIIGIVDVANGKMIRKLETGDGQIRSMLAFSPSGRKLAATNVARLEVWDLLSASRLSEASHKTVTSMRAPKSLEWMDDANVLLDGQYLYNESSQNFVWQYSSIDGVRTARGFSRTSSHSDYADVVAFKLPHSAAERAIADLGANPQTVLVDASTPTQVLVDAPPVIYDRIEAIAKTVGKRSGWNLREKADVSLIARVEQVTDPIEINVSYYATRQIQVGGGPNFGGLSGLGRFFPPSFGPRSINVRSGQSNRATKKLKLRPYFCEFEIRHEGETKWSWRNGLRDGATVSAPEGESDDAIIDRVSAPNIDAMNGVFIPRKIVDESETLTLGRSDLTDSAIVDR